MRSRKNTKPFAVLLLLLIWDAAAIAQLPTGGVNNQSQSATEQGTTDKSKTKNTSPVSVNIQGPVKVVGEISTKEEKEDATSNPIWWTNPDWWLVGVSLFAAIFAFLAFLAANRQATYLISIERAWVVTNMLSTQRAVPQIGPNALFVSCSNQGNTPAWVDEQVCCIIKSRSKTISLTNDSSYGNGSSFSGGVAVTSKANDPEWGVFPDPPKTNFTGDEISDIFEGRLFLFACGFVKYKDVTNKRRETYFCFRFNPHEDRRDLGMWSPIGCPPELNRRS